MNIDLLRDFEVREATLSEGGLENLHQVQRLASHQSGHHLQQLLHKTVLEVGQLRHKEPVARSKKNHQQTNKTIITRYKTMSIEVTSVIPLERFHFLNELLTDTDKRVHTAVELR